MPISWNEIRHNAISFAHDWSGATREDAEAKFPATQRGRPWNESKPILKRGCWERKGWVHEW